MTTPLAELKQFLNSLDDDFDQRVAAAAKRADRASQPIEWEPDPDPFGLDWEWLYRHQAEDPRPSQDTMIPATHQSPQAPTEPVRWRGAVPVGLAASLLIGLLVGWLAFGRGVAIDDMQLLAANASVQFGPPRGGEPQPGLAVSAPFAGFATVVGLAPDRKQQVIPVVGGADIPVPEAGFSQPVPLRPDTTRVVYFVTPTPATEAVRRELDSPTAPRYAPDQVDELITRVQDILAEKGHRRIASGSLVIEQQP